MHVIACAVCDEGIRSLMWAAMQGSLRRLRSLVLTANRLKSLRGLASALSAGALPALDNIVLSSNQIKADGVAELAGARLSDGTSALVSLGKLRLDHNSLGEGGFYSTGEEAKGAIANVPASAVALGQLARVCTSLSVLDLGSNNLTDEHLAALAMAVLEGHAFSTTGGRTAQVDLMLNCCTLHGMVALKAACAKHGYVTVVS